MSYRFRIAVRRLRQHPVFSGAVVGLLWSRAQRERRTLVVRLILGARRRDLFTDVVIETGMLALGGSLGGLAAAWQLTPVARSFLSTAVPVWADVRLTPGTAVVALAVAVVSTLLIALLASRGRFGAALGQWVQETGHGVTASRTERRRQRDLVAGQLGVALMLLVAGSLAVSDYVQMLKRDRQIDAGTLYYTTLKLPDVGHQPAHQALDAVFRALRQRPYVRDAEVGQRYYVNMPGLGASTVYIDGQQTPVDPRLAPRRGDGISSSYFNHGTRLARAGRFFTEDEMTTDATGVIIVNEPLARALWPNQSAVGHRIRFGGWPDEASWLRVVGVIVDAPPGTASVPSFYLPGFRGASSLTLSVRTTLPSQTVADSLMAIVNRAAPGAVGPFSAVADMMRSEQAMARVRSLLVAALATLAALLALVGHTALTSYNVTRRYKELGIRAALGASTADVVLDVLKEALQSSALGFLAGAVGAVIGATVIVPAVLFGSIVVSWPAIAGAFVFMGSCTLIASGAVALCVTRLNPAEVLRAE